jgi:hypothetical protein
MRAAHRAYFGHADKSERTQDDSLGSRDEVVYTRVATRAPS